MHCFAWVSPALAAVNIPDAALKAAINTALDKAADADITQAELESLTELALDTAPDIAAITGLEHATNLTSLYLSKTGVTDLSPLAGLTNLETLYLNNTSVSDISDLSALTNLEDLAFNKTDVTDISAISALTNLVKLRLHTTEVSDISAVSGLANLQVLYIHNTDVADLAPGLSLNLSDFRYQNTPALTRPAILTLVSGNQQTGDAGATLAAPLVVQVQNQVNTVLADVSVSFLVTAGGGSLSATTVSTDADGRAETTLTLGAAAGTNTVQASVQGITSTITFNATATAPEPAPEPEPAPVPTTFEKVSGDHQELAPDAISAPLVVRVKDANGAPLEGVTVAWDLQKGAGPLSATETTTGANGQTSVTVTMGSRGRHTVVATVNNIDTTLTFYAYAQGAPATIELYNGLLGDSGDNQMVPVGQYPLSDLAAVVLDADGHGVNGVRVDWEVRSGGGSLRVDEGFSADTITNGAGVTAQTVRVGPEPGLNTYAATVEGVEGEALFTLEGMTGQVPQDVYVGSGNRQEAYTGKRLWKKLIAQVRDYYGKRMGAGVTVHWEVIEGEATLDHETTETTSTSSTRNVITFGNTPGTIKVKAYIPRVKHFATFTLTALYRIPTDVNFDGVVDVRDLLVVTNALGETEDLGVKDLDADGEITLADIRTVLEALEALVAEGETVTFVGTVPGAPKVSADSLPNLQYWTAEAMIANRAADNLYARGVAVLQSLLEQRTVPEKTALLRNYPNPFNPETWIPYQLAKAADVTVSIYNTQGAMVRTLTLGHQPAGVYQHRTRAAYWDGKNAQGEPVASGVYFYTLTAGEFTATRKMVIRK